MLEAEAQFRRIIGPDDLTTLALAVERDVAAKHTAHGQIQPRQTPTATAAAEAAASPA